MRIDLRLQCPEFRLLPQDALFLEFSQFQHGRKELRETFSRAHVGVKDQVPSHGHDEHQNTDWIGIMGQRYGDRRFFQQGRLRILSRVVAYGHCALVEGAVCGYGENAVRENVSARGQHHCAVSKNDPEIGEGLADSESQYQIQLANALAQAEQLAWEQQQAEEEMALRKKAAALEEMKYLDSRNKAASGTGSPNKPRLTYAQALEQLNAGNTSDVVMEAATYYGLPIGPRIPTGGIVTGVTNASGKGENEGWLAIDGAGRFTTSEIERMIRNGTVRAVRNADGSITYQRT